MDTEYRIYMDGKSWCATATGFVNLQESPSGFGDTPTDALHALFKETIMVNPACDRSACGDFRRGRCDNPDCPAISYAFGSEHQLYLQCKHDLESANDAMREIFPRAHLLAHELECLLMDTKDMATVSKWWGSAHKAIEQWREFCREDDKKTPNAKLTGVPPTDATKGG